MTATAAVRIEAWPPVMTADIAAAYCAEKSVEAFRRRVPRYYPKPVHVPGRGNLWRKEDLDKALQRMVGDGDPADAAEAL